MDSCFFVESPVWQEYTMKLMNFYENVQKQNPKYGWVEFEQDGNKYELASDKQVDAILKTFAKKGKKSTVKKAKVVEPKVFAGDWSAEVKLGR